jgi:hypothetical protein
MVLKETSQGMEKFMVLIVAWSLPSVCVCVRERERERDRQREREREITHQIVYLNYYMLYLP